MVERVNGSLTIRWPVGWSSGARSPLGLDYIHNTNKIHNCQGVRTRNLTKVAVDRKRVSVEAQNSKLVRKYAEYF